MSSGFPSKSTDPFRHLASHFVQVGALRAETGERKSGWVKVNMVHYQSLVDVFRSK